MTNGSFYIFDDTMTIREMENNILYQTFDMTISQSIIKTNNNEYNDFLEFLENTTTQKNSPSADSVSSLVDGKLNNMVGSLANQKKLLAIFIPILIVLTIFISYQYIYLSRRIIILQYLDGFGYIDMLKKYIVITVGAYGIFIIISNGFKGLDFLTVSGICVIMFIIDTVVISLAVKLYLQKSILKIEKGG